MSNDDLRDKVREGYSTIAKKGVFTTLNDSSGSCCAGGGPVPRSLGGGGCCAMATLDVEQLAKHIGYTQEELEASPEAANMGLSCGNPTAIASLKPGEVVLDLGAGGGFDVFIAGPKVGASGRVIGVDMTPDMVSKARKSIRLYAERSGLDNVEFRLGEIEHLPVADASVDVVISNCVLNLSPDKPQVWREIARVLKPGGRVAISDLALLQPLPANIVEMVEALIGCVAGAALVSETELMAKDAGLADLQLEASPGYIDAMTRWEDPLYQQIVSALPPGSKASDYITSLSVRAKKPAGF